VGVLCVHAYIHVRVRRIKNVCLCTRVSMWCMRVRIPCVNVDYVHRVVYICVRACNGCVARVSVCACACM